MSDRVTIRAVVLVCACAFITLTACGPEEPAFPARITEVSPTQVCADIGDHKLFGADAPSAGEDLCAAPAEFFFEDAPSDLAVGDCVMMSSHHPVVAADRRVPDGSCKALDG